MLSLKNSWRWWVCGLLLLATLINYMDRLTLNLLSTHIKTELEMGPLDYGALEAGFAIAFACGGLLFGLLADRYNVFWVYPLAVLAWSAAGFFSGLATTFLAMLACRFALGLAESSNWPCALRTTQRVLPPDERGMGNAILQSGASLGAIALPVALEALPWLFNEAEPSTWRRPFLVIGALGALWAFLWWAILRPADLARPDAPAGAGLGLSLPQPAFLRRFLGLVVLVVTINMTWHFLRAWGPPFLQEAPHKYTQAETNYFSIAYYAATFAGAIAAGAATLWLARAGVGVHASRVLVYVSCALMCLVCLALPYLDGWALVAGFLVAGFGSLGVFPSYYSFTQDLTEEHQGKVNGTLGFSCWVVMAGWQYFIGWLVEAQKSYAVPFVISGLAPLAGLVVFSLLWGETQPEPAEAAGLLPEGPRPQTIMSTPR